jgi:hypothetical protein
MVYEFRPYKCKRTFVRSITNVTKRTKNKKAYFQKPQVLQRNSNQDLELCALVLIVHVLFFCALVFMYNFHKL